MTFEYTVKTRSGSLSQGVIDATSSAEARRQLLEQGMFALSLKERSRAAPRSAVQEPKRPLFQSRIGKSDLLMVTCQLSVMTQAGIDLAEATRNIAQSCPHPALKKVLETLYEDVASGQSMSAALERQKRVFGESYVAAISAAEASGTMTTALNRLAELLRNEIRLRGALLSAMAYPGALCGIAGLVMAAIFFFVLPQFAEVFQDMGVDPPPLTSLLLGIGSAVRENLLLFLLGAGGAVAGGWYLVRQPRTRRMWDNFQLNGFLLRKAVRSLLIGQSFRLLATMLQSNVPLLEAIRLCQRATRNSFYRDLFRQLEQEVEIGHGISETMMAAPFIPPGAAQMVQSAEQAGKLGEILETVGLFYEEQGERELNKLVKLMEPMIVVVMGVIVSLVVASVVLPLLDVTSVSG
jgi:type IV pilus assembly protein PilC